MTCGIDNIYKIDRLDTKRFFLKGTKDNLNEKKRSHPKEKSGQGATDLSLSIPTDPTPKRNLVRERQSLIDPYGSHPEGNFGWEIERIGYWTSKKDDLDL